MDNGSISKEFYVGRYIYLTCELSKLPDVRIMQAEGHVVLSVHMKDENTGKVKRRRLSSSKKEWAELYQSAIRRQNLERSLKLLLNHWKEDYGGSLPYLAAKYMVIPNTTNRFDSNLYARLKEDQNTYPNRYSVPYKGYMMRSQFEVEAARLLDSMGIDYKYEVSLFIGEHQVYPDLTVNLPEFNRCGFVEAMGGMDNLKYAGHNVQKYRAYINAGVYPNRDLAMISGDSDYRPDPETMKRVVGTMLSSIAAQHVFKVR